MASIEEIRNKLKELEGNRPKKITWKPDDEHVVRCLPVNNGEDLGHEVGFHYGVDDGKMVYCPATTGEQCDFCDLAAYLYAWKDESGVDKPKDVKARDFEWYKKIQRAVKYYVPIIVRTADPDKNDGPFFWTMSQRTYKTLVEICVNEETNGILQDKTGIKDGGYRCLSNPDWAFDVSVSLKKAGEKGNGTKYDLTDVKERKRLSELLPDKTAAKKLLSNLPSFTDAVRMQTSAEISKIFAKFKAGFNQDVPPADEPGSEYPTNSAEKLTGKGTVDDVEAKLRALVDKKRAEKNPQAKA